MISIPLSLLLHICQIYSFRYINISNNCWKIRLEYKISSPPLPSRSWSGAWATSVLSLARWAQRWRATTTSPRATLSRCTSWPRRWPGTTSWRRLWLPGMHDEPDSVCQACPMNQTVSVRHAWWTRPCLPGMPDEPDYVCQACPMKQLERAEPDTPFFVLKIIPQFKIIAKLSARTHSIDYIPPHINEPNKTIWQNGSIFKLSNRWKWFIQPSLRINEIFIESK